MARKARKAKINAASLGLAEPRQFKNFALNLASFVFPSTIYEHFERGEYRTIDEKLPPDSPCYTLAVCTLGAKIEEREKEARTLQEKQLIELCAGVFLSASSAFVRNLASSEARAEGFELLETSPLNSIGESWIGEAKAVMKDFESEKISVRVSDSGEIVPRHTSLFFIGWARKRRK